MCQLIVENLYKTNVLNQTFFHQMYFKKLCMINHWCTFQQDDPSYLCNVIHQFKYSHSFYSFQHDPILLCAIKLASTNHFEKFLTCVFVGHLISMNNPLDLRRGLFRLLVKSGRDSMLIYSSSILYLSGRDLTPCYVKT